MSVAQSGSLASRSGNSDDEALQPLFDKIRTIAAAVNNGDTGSATDLLNDLLKRRDSELFQDLGRVTRQLHDSMIDVGVGESAAEIAQTLLPDTQNRLAYVLEKTEEAADKTLTAVENALPLTDRLTSNAEDLNVAWQNQAIDKASLQKAVPFFFERTSQDANLMRSYLNDALMAQSYQDLTGQVLRSMMTVMQELEERLVGLVREHGGQTALETTESKTVDGTQAYGPQIDKGGEDSGCVSGQDEVDDLLSSLGF